MVPLHLIHLHQVPVFEQLQLEEALLRADQRNWCLLNTGTEPAIVLGISGNPAELIHEQERQKHQVPMIRRFSGGGTVVVDQSTCFVTFIFNQESLPIEPFPAPILRWTEKLYQPLFAGLDFNLRENDYTIGHLKCGGNAQYLTKGRWLHHTTFLWDYAPHLMECLTLPKKTPTYRQQRPHSDFLCKLKDHLPLNTPQEFLHSIQQHLNILFKIQPIPHTTAQQLLNLPHRKSTKII